MDARREAEDARPMIQPSLVYLMAVVAHRDLQLDPQQNSDLKEEDTIKR